MIQRDRFCARKIQSAGSGVGVFDRIELRKE